MTEYSFLTHGVLAIAVICWILFREFPLLRRDNFRTDIRKLRDDLFDFMWENGLPYDDPAYIQARQSMNGLLRWSNTLSLPILVIMWRHMPDSIEPEIAKSTNDKLNEKINEVDSQVMDRVVAFLFYEGFVVRTLWVVFKTFEWMKRMRGLALRSVRQIILESSCLGQPQLSPAQQSILHGR